MKHEFSFTNYKLPLLVALAGFVLTATFACAQPVLTVNGVNANYTTSKLFIDEANDTVFPTLTVILTPNEANVTQAEVFSNLNNRDRAGLDANSDGIHDGILPPDGSLITAAMTNTYYQAHVMTSVGGGQYQVVLPANRTGAYRLTARWKVSGDPNWHWYSSSGRRDHAITVSPRHSRDAVMYELNTITVEATGPSFAQRSTFDDLLGAADGDTDGFDPFNLQYLQNLGVNWLWFQPIHPQGIDGRQIDPDTGFPYEVGSPYAVKNFFEISPLMGSDNTSEGALLEFQNFVNKTDQADIFIMLDAPFNHTSYDCELADLGAAYFGGNPTNEIRNIEARFYSRSGDYCQRAFNAGNIAVAPDRGDFGKFADTYDVFFGRYAALVCQNPADNGNYLNEGDWFDYSAGSGNFDTITHNVWRYFAEYILFWLDQTGCTNGTSRADQLFKGFDGLRADFAQGLPPQAWEYVVNRTRARKWAFVFMAESLDGGPVTYRSNRHFDVLNENITFALQSAGNVSDYRNIYEGRRIAYGQGLVLLNSTSHDESNYADPWQAVIRFAVNGTIDGVPMIFYGQELGISGGTFGFDRYELNFGKLIPHFKKYNSLKPAWDDTNFGNDQLYPVYAGIAQARQVSRALRSSNRYFLNQVGGAVHQQLYAVAKYETANASPAFSDVVFAFANLDRNNAQSGTFNVNITQNSTNLFGIKSNRTYNVKNIAAYLGANPNRRNEWLWGAGRTGADVLANGVFALINKVPTDNAAWTNAPYEAQYLQLYDVTPPPVAGTPTTPKAYAIDNPVTFTWPMVSDPEGGISGYRLIVGTTPGGSNVFDGIVTATSQVVTGAFGQTLYARVIAINNAGIEGGASPNSAGAILLDPDGDFDSDGMKNGDEDIAGTNPLDAGSLLKILSLTGGGTLLTWSSEPGKSYQVLGATNVNQPFSAISGVIPSAGAMTSYTNPAGGAGSLFYRVELVP